MRFRVAVIGAILVVLIGACSATDGTTQPIDDTAEPATTAMQTNEGSIGPNEWWVVAMTPDEQHLLVSTFFGGVASGCSRWESWEINESSEQVTVEALLWRRYERDWCTGDAATEVIEIHLDEPLGDRSLTGCARMGCLGGEPLGWLNPYFGVAATADGNSAVTDGYRVTGLAASGEVLWEQKRWPTEFVGASSDAILTYEAGQTTARDPLTGLEIWSNSGAPAVITDGLLLQRPAANSALALLDTETWNELWTATEPYDMAVIDDERVTIIADGAGSEDRAELLLFDTTTGELLVRRPMDDGIEDHVPGFEGIAGTGDLVVVGGWQANLVVLGSDGEELKRGPTGLGTPIGAVEGAVILAGHSRIFAIDPLTAAEVWERDDLDLDTIEISGNALWALHPRDGTVSRLDPQTGETLWESPIGINHTIAVASTKTVTYVATPLSVIALDTATGEQLWWTYIPYQGPEPG